MHISNLAVVVCKIHIIEPLTDVIDAEKFVVHELETFIYMSSNSYTLCENTSAGIWMITISVVPYTLGTLCLFTPAPT